MPCLIIGTSSIVYLVAMFAPQVAHRGVPVAEFNLVTTQEQENFSMLFFFQFFNMLYKLV